MQDVQNVFLVTRRLWYIALGLFILIGLSLAYRQETFPELARGLKNGGLLVAGVVAAVGLLAVIAWQVWFVAFHQIFFAAGTWTFNPYDTLIRLFPERFWYDAVLTLSSLSLIGGLGVALIGWYAQLRNQSISKARIARVFKPS